MKGPGVAGPGVTLSGVTGVGVPGAGLPGAGVAGVGIKPVTPPSETTLIELVVGAGGSDPQNFTNVGGTIFFTATDAINGRELWKSDGTVAGTSLVKDIFVGVSNSNPTSLTNVNGRLFFAANGAERSASSCSSAMELPPAPCWSKI